MFFKSTPQRAAASPAPETSADTRELEKYVQALLGGELSRPAPRLRDPRLQAVADLVEQFARKESDMLVELSREINHAVYRRWRRPIGSLPWRPRIERYRRMYKN